MCEEKDLGTRVSVLFNFQPRPRSGNAKVMGRCETAKRSTNVSNNKSLLLNASVNTSNAAFK